MHNHHFLLGKYLLLELLHEGHHTEVWLAENDKIRKKVTIKILIPQIVRAGDARLFARKLFFNEAQTLARLTYPHIVQIFDYEAEGQHGWPYLVMEYAPFGSLADRYAPGERIPLSTVRLYTSQIGRAIHYIHTQGLIHRDIKPQNMFLKTRNVVILGDFGLVTRFHQKHCPWMKMEFGGTRIYMAPEQEGGEPVPASDQYAFATVVFEWLTGYWPFYGDAKELSWQRRHLSPPLMRAIMPEIPAAVEWVVLKALNKSPGRRFKTMLDFTLEFEEACQPVKEVKFKIFTGDSRSLTSYDRNEVNTKFTGKSEYQQSVGLVSRPDSARMGDVIVSIYPEMASYRQSEDDFLSSLFTSDEKTGVGKDLIKRWQNMLRLLRSIWERISEYMWGGV